MKHVELYVDVHVHVFVLTPFLMGNIATILSLYEVTTNVVLYT